MVVHFLFPIEKEVRSTKKKFLPGSKPFSNMTLSTSSASKESGGSRAVLSVSNNLAVAASTQSTSKSKSSNMIGIYSDQLTSPLTDYENENENEYDYYYEAATDTATVAAAVAAEATEILRINEGLASSFMQKETHIQFHNTKPNIAINSNSNPNLNPILKRSQSEPTKSKSKSKAQSPSHRTIDSILTSTNINNNTSLNATDSTILSPVTQYNTQLNAQTKYHAQASHGHNENDHREVLVGTPVKEGHANYLLMYDMLTGIRISVCSLVLSFIVFIEFYTYPYFD
jgi:hypothetical protein